MPEKLSSLSASVAARLVARKETLAVAESSAGGLISAALLSIPGASAYFMGGAVIYTQAARRAFLAVPDEAMSGIRSSSEPYALLKADFDAMPGAAGYLIQHQGSVFVGTQTQSRTWAAFVSAGWLAAQMSGPSLRHTIPDLSTAPGFMTSWGLPGSPVTAPSWTMWAFTTNGPLGSLIDILALQTRSVAHGFTWRSVSRSGNGP